MLDLRLQLNQAALQALLDGHELSLTIEEVEVTLRASDEVVENYRQQLQLSLLRMLPVGSLPN